MLSDTHINDEQVHVTDTNGGVYVNEVPKQDVRRNDITNDTFVNIDVHEARIDGRDSKYAKVHSVPSQYLNNYVNVEVNKVSMFAMVDSGAEISVISSELVNDKQFRGCQQYASDKVFIETATGERTTIEGIIIVKANIKNHDVLCKLYIVPGVQPNFILGQDFLCKNNVHLKFGKDGITFSMDPARIVVSKETVTIPPNTQAVLIGKLRGLPLPTEVVGITSGSPHVLSLGLMTTKSLSVNKHGYIQYGCANFGTEPAFFYSKRGKFR